MSKDVSTIQSIVLISRSYNENGSYNIHATINNLSLVSDKLFCKEVKKIVKSIEAMTSNSEIKAVVHNNFTTALLGEYDIETKIVDLSKIKL